MSDCYPAVEATLTVEFDLDRETTSKDQFQALDIGMYSPWEYRERGGTGTRPPSKGVGPEFAKALLRSLSYSVNRFDDAGDAKDLLAGVSEAPDEEDSGDEVEVEDARQMRTQLDINYEEVRVCVAIPFSTFSTSRRTWAGWLIGCSAQISGVSQQATVRQPVLRKPRVLHSTACARF